MESCCGDVQKCCAIDVSGEINVLLCLQLESCFLLISCCKCGVLKVLETCFMRTPCHQVKDLDSNIRWNDLSNSNPLPKLGKEYRKSLKPLWKATICQKSEDEEQVKYLLDFGKRKNIPDVVTKHGVLQEDSSNESKKYWLDESYVPINLLKTFEARELEKMLKKTSLEVVSDKKDKGKMAKPKREKGLSYLLTRGENSDQYLCRHCGKLVRERYIMIPTGEFF